MRSSRSPGLSLSPPPPSAPTPAPTPARSVIRTGGGSAAEVAERALATRLLCPLTLWPTRTPATALGARRPRFLEGPAYQRAPPPGSPPAQKVCGRGLQLAELLRGNVLSREFRALPAWEGEREAGGRSLAPLLRATGRWVCLRGAGRGDVQKTTQGSRSLASRSAARSPKGSSLKVCLPSKCGGVPRLSAQRSGRLRQERRKFEPSPDDSVRPCLKTTKRNRAKQQLNRARDEVQGAGLGRPGASSFGTVAWAVRGSRLQNAPSESSLWGRLPREESRVLSSDLEASAVTGLGVTEPPSGSSCGRACGVRPCPVALPPLPGVPVRRGSCRCGRGVCPALSLSTQRRRTGTRRDSAPPSSPGSGRALGADVCSIPEQVSASRRCSAAVAAFPKL